MSRSRAAQATAILALALCTALPRTGSAGEPEDDGKGVSSLHPHASDAGIAGGLEVARPIRYGGLSVFPVVDVDSGKRDDEDAVVTLADALATGDIRVTEMTGGGAVAQLQVHNTGKRPVLVMAGEIIYGGSQDRVITHDVVIPPTARPIAVRVNCVERGRWDSDPARKAFRHGGWAEIGLRRVVQVERSQDATWRAVTALNGAKARALEDLGYDAMGLAPATDTYMASIRAREVDERVDKVSEEILDRLAKLEHLVGVIVAFDGRVVASELYGHPEVFAEVRDLTIAAIARDGVTSGAIDRDVAPPSEHVAARFLEDAFGSMAATGVAPAGGIGGERTISYVIHDTRGTMLHMATYSR